MLIKNYDEFIDFQISKHLLEPMYMYFTNKKDIRELQLVFCYDMDYSRGFRAGSRIEEGICNENGFAKFLRYSHYNADQISIHSREEMRKCWMSHRTSTIGIEMSKKLYDKTDLVISDSIEELVDFVGIDNIDISNSIVGKNDEEFYWYKKDTIKINKEEEL